jgi:hypothetical protein
MPAAQETLSALLDALEADAASLFHEIRTRLVERFTRAQASICDADWYFDKDIELLLRSPVMAIDSTTRVAKVGREEIALTRRCSPPARWCAASRSPV